MTACLEQWLRALNIMHLYLLALNVALNSVASISQIANIARIARAVGARSTIRHLRRLKQRWMHNYSTMHKYSAAAFQHAQCVMHDRDSKFTHYSVSCWKMLLRQYWFSDESVLKCLNSLHWERVYWCAIDNQPHPLCHLTAIWRRHWFPMRGPTDEKVLSIEQ